MSIDRPSTAGEQHPDTEALLEQHLPRLRAFVSKRASAMIRNRETSADLAQSVCREVLEHRDLFRHGDGDAFRHWLFKTAERKLLDRARYHGAAKRDVRRTLGDDVADAAADARSLFATPSRDASAREDLERARAAFERLPERTRRVILLARVEGLSSARIAEELGTAPGTVRSLLSRGLAQITDALDAR